MSMLLQNGQQVFLDNNGNPLVSGQVYFYIPSTSTPKNTWQDSALTILNTNPVVLDSAGRATIWGAGSYRQVVYDSLGNLIWDKVTNDVLSEAIAKDGSNTPTANLPMAGFKHTGLGPGTTNGDSLRYEQLFTTGLLSLLGTLNVAGIVTLSSGLNGARGSVAMNATTMDLWSKPNIIDGTGSAVTITAIVNAPQAGATRILYPIAGTTITNGATFAVDGNANYTSLAGDAFIFEAITTSTYRVHIVAANGASVSDEWKKLEASTFNAASSLSLILTSYSSYRDIKIVLTGVSMGTNGSGITMQFSTNGGNTYDGGATDYQHANSYSTSGAAGANIGSGGDVSMLTCVGGSNVANLLSDSEVQIYEVNNAAKMTRSRWEYNYFNSVGAIAHGNGSGYRAAAQITNAVRFIPSSGVFTGQYAIYGRN